MNWVVQSILDGDAAAALAALAAGAPPDGVSDDGTSAVLLALYRGMGEVVAELRRRRGDGDLTLAEAAAVGATGAVAGRLRGGAPVDERSADGFTPLQLACFFDRPEAAALLLRAGADVAARATGRMDVQPLHAAAASPTGSCLGLLVAAGAPLDEEQSGGFTALDELLQRGAEDHVALLVAAGATRR